MQYDHKFESFQIISTNNKRIIKSRGEKFLWDKKTNRLMHGENTIGTAKDPKEVIQALLKSINKEPCVRIKFN